MRWFHNLNTHNKLLLAFALLSLTAALASGWSIHIAMQLHQQILTIQSQAEHLEQTAKAQTNFQGLVIMSRNYWLSRSPFFLGQASRYQQQIGEYLRQAMIEAQSPDEREDLTTLSSLLADHAASLQQISDQLESNTATLEEVSASPESQPQGGSLSPGSTPDAPPGSAPLGGLPQGASLSPKATPGAPYGSAPSDEPPSDQVNLLLTGQSNLPGGFVSEQIIMEANQSADQVLIHFQNMTAKRGLYILELSDQVAALTRSLAFAALLALFMFTLLAILAARVAAQVAEPILHLTNAVVSFENETFQPDQLEPFNRSGNEMGQLARAFTAMATSIIDALRLKDQFIDAAARFVPSQYLDLLEKDSIVDIKLGDHVSAEMAVMFSDLRDFTRLSERMTPQQNFDFVNEYLELVSPIIQRHDGFIVKFLGDGMMAIFPYGADSAVLASIEKQQAVQDLNGELESRGLFPIQIGVGIHTGHMMVGMVGEELRMQGDAFSDTVNLTSRVEGLNKYFGTSIIITAETLMRLQRPITYHLRHLGKVEVKGRDQPIDLYEIFDGQNQEIIDAKLAVNDDFERGLKAYMAGRFSKAQEYFAAVLQRAPGDQVTALYARLVKQWLGKEPPEGWEGAIVMMEK